MIQKRQKIVESWPVPTNVKELRSQKRFCVYHYPHIPFVSTPNIGRVSKTSSYQINDQKRLMETVLAGLQWDICLIYLDNVIVLGRSFEDMVINFRKVYDRLLTAGLKLKAKKCHLFCKPKFIKSRPCRKSGFVSITTLTFHLPVPRT
jgi:hypothetical protein